MLVPRYLRHGVGGRIDSDGNEHAPLALQDIDSALEVFAAEGVEAVAVAFFNSFLNDTHETAAANHVAASRPDG